MGAHILLETQWHTPHLRLHHSRSRPLSHTPQPARRQNTCKFIRSPLGDGTRICIHTHMRTVITLLLVSVPPTSPQLSGLVQVGRQESGGRPKLSAPLTVIVWRQTYRVELNLTSSSLPQQGLIDPAWHRRGRRNEQGGGGEGETATLCRSSSRQGSHCWTSGFKWIDGCAWIWEM